MTDRELMQMAMETIQGCRPSSKSYKQMRETVEALRDRLAQPEHVHAIDISQKCVDETAKRKHEWVGLTEEEIVGATCECIDDGTFNMFCAYDFAKTIEVILGEKNT